MVQQLVFDLGADARADAGPEGAVYWLAFTADTPAEEARHAFMVKFGRAPRDVRAGLGGLILAGPAPRGRDAHGG